MNEDLDEVDYETSLDEIDPYFEMDLDLECETFTMDESTSPEESENASPEEVNITNSPVPSPKPATMPPNSQIGGGQNKNEDMAVQTQNPMGEEDGSGRPFPYGNYMAVPNFNHLSTYDFLKDIKGEDLLLPELYDIAIVLIELVDPNHPLDRDERRIKHRLIERLDRYKSQIFMILQYPDTRQWIKEQSKKSKKNGKK